MPTFLYTIRERSVVDSIKNARSPSNNSVAAGNATNMCGSDGTRTLSVSNFHSPLPQQASERMEYNSPPLFAERNCRNSWYCCCLSRFLSNIRISLTSTFLSVGVPSIPKYTSPTHITSSSMNTYSPAMPDCRVNEVILFFAWAKRHRKTVFSHRYKPFLHIGWNVDPAILHAIPVPVHSPIAT